MTRPAFADSPVRLRLTSPPTYWRCEPSWSWRARPPLADHLLWYVLDGVGEVAVGGLTRPLSPASAVVFVPGDEPVAGHDPRRRLLIFGMHFQVTGRDTPVVSPPARGGQVRDRTLAAALARRCEAGYRRGDPLGVRQSELCLEQLLCLLWEDTLHPPAGPVDAALAELALAIRQDPSRRWSVAEMAAATSLSRAQFTRRFVAHTGMSPLRYLITARIERAHRLLTETDTSVTRVAATMGYADVASFSRQYRRHTGRSPRDDLTGRT